MGRKVSVGLEADVAGFIRPVEAAAKATENLDDKIESVDRSLNKIPADAAKAGAALKLLGGDVGAVGDKISSLGEKNTGLAVLDAKIKASRSEVRKLADEFVRTGDIDVFKKLGEAEGKLRGLQDTRKKFAAALTDGVEDVAKVLPKKLAKGGEEAGSEFAKLFSSGLQGGLSNPLIGPVLVGIAAAAAVPLASLIGAALGGAVSLAGAGGAAGLGLAGAWMGDPVKYQAMWNKAIDGIQHRWLASSAAFGNELEAVLKIVDQTLRDLPVEKILALSQSFVTPLAGGLGAGLTEAAKGFADLLASAQPVVDRLGPELADLGHDIGDSLRMIGLGSEGGADALGDLTSAIGYTIKAVSLLILGFESAYTTGKKWARGVEDIVVDAIGLPATLALENFAGGLLAIDETGINAARSLGQTKDASFWLVGGLAEAAKSAYDTKIEVTGLNDALTETRNTMLGLADANIALAQGWLDLKKGLEDGKRTLDMNTQAGIDNVTNIKDQIANAEQLRLQQIETGDGTVEAINSANAAYDTSIERIRRMAVAAGFNKDQVDALITSISAVPPAKETKITTPGLATALEQGIALGNALNNLHNKTVTVTVKQVGDNPKGQSRGGDFATGGIRRAQVGMILPPSDPGTVLAAEPQTGGELLLPLRGISQNRAMALAQVAGDSYGFNVSRMSMISGRMSSAAGGGGPVQVELTLRVDPAGRSASIGPLVQQAFLDQSVQVFVGGQRVQVRP